MTGHRSRLDPSSARIRTAVTGCLQRAGIRGRLLVATSGGPDSLALAAAAAFVSRHADIDPIAVIVDHGLQPGSAAVADQAAVAVQKLGLPAQIRRVEVPRNGAGPEAAARDQRYRALVEAAREEGAAGILLGHTRDDQAESVLLGLVRGSGTTSLAGMRESSLRDGVTLLRPLLSIPRSDTVASCAAQGLTPWQDPQNTDPRFTRSRIRTNVMPYLEKELGPGVSAALSRSAHQLAEDADFIAESAERAYRKVTERVDATGEITADRRELAALPAAIRHRIYLLAVRECSGASLTRRHVDELDRLVLVSNAPTACDLPGTKVERAHVRIRFLRAPSDIDG
ncbi:MAG TPA: tRNA lysidine(34) synthetase TilS [Pseudoclavibacter sp.]|nr:tRNA lysidine(34) synthetase TilS [Pseudoclavibacter sp.]